MSWEISAALGQAEPPFQLFAASSPNVDSWSEEVLTLPGGDELGFRRRMIISIDCRAITSPTASQIDPTKLPATYCFLSRNGRIVTPHVMTRIFQGGRVGSNDETTPIFRWEYPFILPARGGDTLTVMVPGDSDATPTQDWELGVLMGRER